MMFILTVVCSTALTLFIILAILLALTYFGEQPEEVKPIPELEGFKAQLPPPETKAEWLTVGLWTIICIALGVAFMTVVARAEICLPQIDNTIEKRSGYKWLWRMVDGDPRKCWYYSNTLLPKEDLVWSYTTREFDADVLVRERRYYFPETMELKRFELMPYVDDGR